MKRLIAILISLLLFTGCAAQGVETAVHNAVVDERDALQRDFDELAEELAVARLEISSLQENTEIDEVDNSENVINHEMTLNFMFGKRVGVYTGELLNGLPNGYGIFDSANSAGEPWTYTGSWYFGHFSGEGKTTFFLDGYWIEESGLYENDYIVSGTRKILALTETYEGEFGKDGRRDGNGKLIDSNGDILFEGAFINGEPVAPNETDTPSAATTNIVPQESPAPTIAPTPSPAVTQAETSNVTTGQHNALKRAKEYLSVMPFSRKGLIEQLKHDKYTQAEAEYGVENCNANWSEQAAKKAKAYLEVMSFSRDGLIDQLKFDGFTNEQASYGVSQNGL